MISKFPRTFFWAICSLVFTVVLSAFLLFWNAQVKANSEELREFVLTASNRDLAEHNFFRVQESLSNLKNAGLILCAKMSVEGSEVPADSILINCDSQDTSKIILFLSTFPGIKKAEEPIQFSSGNVSITIVPRLHPLFLTALSALAALTFLSLVALLSLTLSFSKFISTSQLRNIDIFLSGISKSGLAGEPPYWIQKHLPTLVKQWKMIVSELTMQPTANNGDQSHIARQLAHDLRTPLAALKTSLEGNSINVELLSKAVQRLEQMIQSILQSTSQVSKRRPLTEITREIVNEWNSHQKYKNKNIRIVYENGEFADTLIVDPIASVRILNNLIENSSLVLTSGGIIKIEIGVNSFTPLRVSDNGPGIPEHVRPHIFKQAYSYGKAGGHGLGLMIVKRLSNNLGWEPSYVHTERGARFDFVSADKG